MFQDPRFPMTWPLHMLKKHPVKLGFKKEILCSPLSPERESKLTGYSIRFFRVFVRSAGRVWADWTVPGFPPLEGSGRILDDTRGPQHGNP